MINNYDAKKNIFIGDDEVFNFLNGMNITFIKKNEGQLMLEAMIAVTIAVMGILGFLTLLSNSVGLNRVVTDQYIGNYLAAEGVEVVKNMIDSNVQEGNPWNQGFLPPAGPCFEVDYKTFAREGPRSVPCNASEPLKLDGASGVYSYGSGVNTPFSRIVSVTPGDPPNDSSELIVNSKVVWQARGGSFSAIVEDHFFDWRP